MAYREPGVTVTQVFADAVPALAVFALPNVTVGPVFQVVSQATAGSYSGLLATLDFPGQMAGTFVDLRAVDPDDLVAYPVKIDLKNTVVRVLNGTAGNVAAAGDTELTDATASVFANIQVGDVINIASGANAGNYTVREKIDNNTLKTNEAFPAQHNTADLAYTIRRNIGADGSLLNIPTTTAGVVLDADDGVTLPAALTTTVSPIGSVPIIDATVLLSYRALRVDKSADVWEYGQISELQADFGLDQIVPENPAVFGAYVALNNSVTKTNLLALNQFYLTDEALSYLNAYDVLALTDMYAISALTHNTAVHTSLKAHVEGMSVPSKKLERVGIVNRRLVLKAFVTEEVSDAASDGTGLIITSASSHFITDGVVPGHFANMNGIRSKILSVDSQTQITVETDVGTSLTGEDLIIDKDLQKSEQAATISAYAKSLGTRRFVLTFPDIVKCPVGNTIRQVPGYFLNSAVGALTTGLPTQQGLTNLGIALFTGVVRSTKYFDSEQLNTLADGGVMIFVQDILDVTVPYVRHQLTTDRSAIKFQEYSVTKNVDFIAKFIRNNHKRFIGQYNIVDGTFDDLKTNAKGIINFLSENTKLPKFGGVIKGGKLDKIQQDPVNIDTIVEKYILDIPIPLNNLDITIVV